MSPTLCVWWFRRNEASKSWRYQSFPSFLESMHVGTVRDHDPGLCGLLFKVLLFNVQLVLSRVKWWRPCSTRSALAPAAPSQQPCSVWAARSSTSASPRRPRRKENLWRTPFRPWAATPTSWFFDTRRLELSRWVLGWQSSAASK